MYKPVPPDTWTLAFGWFMHAIFEMRYGFPFHHNLLPIFVSFHCNERDAADAGGAGLPAPARADRLPGLDDGRHPAQRRRPGLLLRLHDHHDQHRLPGPAGGAAGGGSGRPTSTCPDGAVPPGAGSPTGTATTRIRFRSFTTNVYDATGAAGDLPPRASGAGHQPAALLAARPARSASRSTSSRRTAPTSGSPGLIDITDAEFGRIRDGIDAKLQRVLTAILAGGSREAVYRLWRELTADDVEVARRRRAAPPPRPAPRRSGSLTTSPGAVASTTVAERRPAGRCSGGSGARRGAPAGRPQAGALGVLLDSLSRHASRRPARLADHPGPGRGGRGRAGRAVRLGLVSVWCPPAASAPTCAAGTGSRWWRATRTCCCSATCCRAWTG